MTAPVDRGQVAPVAGLVGTAPAGTQIGDLVVVITGTSTTVTGIPAHTLQAGFTEIGTQSLDDGANDLRLSVAYKIATQAGAQTYQAYTASTGTSVTGLHVIQLGTFQLASPAPSITFATLTTNGVPNPPVTGALTGDFKFLAIGLWAFSASTANTPTVMANYANLTHLAASAINDLAWATRDRTALVGATEDPAAYGDNSTPTGSISATLAISGLVARSGTGDTASAAQTAAGSGTNAIGGAGTTSSNAEIADGAGANAIAGTGSTSSSAQLADGAGTVEEAARSGSGETTSAAQGAEGVGVAAISGTGASASSAQASDGSASAALAGSATTVASVQSGEGVGAAAVGGTGASSSAAQGDDAVGAAAINGTGVSTASAQIAEGAGTTGDALPDRTGTGGTHAAAQPALGVGTVAIAGSGATLAAAQIADGTNRNDVDPQHATATITSSQPSATDASSQPSASAAAVIIATATIEAE